MDFLRKAYGEIDAFFQMKHALIRRIAYEQIF